MTNKEWLDYLAHNAPDELAAWFDAEHVETEERALDGDTAALNAKIAYPMHHGYKGVKADRVIFDELHDEPDSREKLEAEASELVAEYAASGDVCDALYHGMLGLLDRQVAITDAEWEDELEQLHIGYKPLVDELFEQVNELTAERDKLQEQVDMKDNCIENIMQTLHETQARASNLADDLLTANNERDNWKANCEDWKKHARAAENACYETMLEREEYREKFGKCIDYADAIHALMDDEGMA